MSVAAVREDGPRGEAGPAPLLKVRDLSVSFGRLTVVDGVSFEVAEGRTLAIVGESGCGKSVSALALTRLLPRGARADVSELTLAGEDLANASEQRMEALRGSAIGMIFQEPMTALNPVITIGTQIVETLMRHERLPRRAARERAQNLLTRVGIPDAAQRLDEYPHQLSGGMRQRVMIAIAIACGPKLLIADEPTTALDVTIQAQILELLRTLQAELGMALVLITHDLGVVSAVADDVVVMYAGRIVEEAPAETLFRKPCHPYTRGLIASLPPADADLPRLQAIPGIVPPPSAWPPGCRFAPRCAYAADVCRSAMPPLAPAPSGGRAACVRLDVVLAEEMA